MSYIPVEFKAGLNYVTANNIKVNDDQPLFFWDGVTYTNIGTLSKIRQDSNSDNFTFMLNGKQETIPIHTLKGHNIIFIKSTTGGKRSRRRGRKSKKIRKKRKISKRSR